MSKKKLVLGASILGATFILLSSASTFAQGWGYRTRGYDMMGRMGWNSNVPEKYWLTAQQLDKVREIRSSYDDKILPLQQRLYSLRVQVRGYASDPDADLGKIKSYQEEIRGLEGKIDNVRLDARGEINNVLTKDQRAYFSDDSDWWNTERGMTNNMGMMDNMRMCPMMSDRQGW